MTFLRRHTFLGRILPACLFPKTLTAKTFPLGCFTLGLIKTLKDEADKWELNAIYLGADGGITLIQRDPYTYLSVGGGSERDAWVYLNEDAHKTLTQPEKDAIVEAAHLYVIQPRRAKVVNKADCARKEFMARFEKMGCPSPNRSHSQS